MSGFIESLKNNFSNLFSVIGIVLTIYFSVFYIPGYVREVRNEKVLNIHNELIENFQELVYNKQKVDIDDLKTFIKGKELRNNVDYPYSIDELLIQVQERFLENKFIPLVERRELIDTIDSIRDNLTSVNITQNSIIVKKEKKDWLGLISSLVSMVIGVLASILGLISIYFKEKRQKEYELGQDIEQKKEEIEKDVKSSIGYEKVVENILSQVKHGDNFVTFTRNQQIDFVLESQNCKYAIEVKYQSRPISTNVIKQILSYSEKTNSRPMLVTNSSLTRGALEEIKVYDSEHENEPFVVVSGETYDELYTNLSSFFKENYKNSA